jgi:hypothetical protein
MALTTLTRWQELHVAFKAQTAYTFVGSSLLFVYEGDVSPFAFNKDTKFRPMVKMIDFAHVSHGKEGGKAPADPGYITGLETLI